MNIRSRLVCLCTCLAASLLFAGCSSSSGTLSREPVSYLSVSPIAAVVSVAIDDLPPVTLEPQRKPRILQLKPGKHRVRISRNQTIVVDRVILVSDQQTFEISIP